MYQSLTKSVESPADHVTIFFQRSSVIPAAIDGNHIRQVCRHIALTEGITSPTDLS
jgi:hypothetical protein